MFVSGQSRYRPVASGVSSQRSTFKLRGQVEGQGLGFPRSDYRTGPACPSINRGGPYPWARSTVTGVPLERGFLPSGTSRAIPDCQCQLAADSRTVCYWTYAMYAEASRCRRSYTVNPVEIPGIEPGSSLLRMRSFRLSKPNLSPKSVPFRSPRSRPSQTGTNQCVSRLCSDPPLTRSPIPFAMRY